MFVWDPPFPTCVFIISSEPNPCEIDELYFAGKLSDWQVWGYCGYDVEQHFCNEDWHTCSWVDLYDDSWDCIANEEKRGTAQVSICSCVGYDQSSGATIVADAQPC